MSLTTPFRKAEIKCAINRSTLSIDLISMRPRSKYLGHFLAFILLFCAIAEHFADSDGTPIEGRVTASSGGKYFMILSPIGERQKSWLWTMYQVDERGLFKEAWSRDGTYAREILIADDGVHIACMETWPTGRPEKRTPLIAIYKENQLVKAITLGDLVQDHGALPISTSHYRWLDKDTPPFARGDYLFLKTAIGPSYVITMTTGAISKIEIPEREPRY
jgi:hypothetical protein